MIGRESGGLGLTGFTLKTARDPSWLSDPRFGLFPASDVEGYRGRADFARSRPDEMLRAEVALRPYKTTIAAISRRRRPDCGGQRRAGCAIRIEACTPSSRNSSRRD